MKTYYKQRKQSRRSIRLKGYDYGQKGLYFLTLCVQNRQHIFGKIINGNMVLNAFGIIAQEEWLKTPEIRKNITLGVHVIMPNHIHGVIQINYKIKTKNDIIGAFQAPSHNIGAIIRGYKGATTKRIKQLILEMDREDKYKNDNSEYSKGERKGEYSKGELQFAPTVDPTVDKRIISRIDTSRSIWQRDYYEHIIRDKRAYDNISRYIINNPKKWEADKLNGGKGNKVL